MVYQIFFSPTGGTKKVAGILGRAWREEIREIDLSLSTEAFKGCAFQKEDICIIAVPSFGGRVPEAALSQIRKLKGGSARAVLTAVYGNRAYDDTLLELEDTLNLCGFRSVAAVAAVAEHSIMRRYGAGRPDSRDEKELEAFAQAIKAVLEAGGEYERIKVPGNTPYREYNGVPFKPKADKRCTGCGLCAEKCPVGAIPKEKPSDVNEEKCISCMRCVSLCPQHARELNKMVLLAVSQKLKKACAARKENELFIPPSGRGGADRGK